MQAPIIFSIALIISFSTSLLADNHIEHILDNTDISWAAETYTVYTPNHNSYIVGKKAMNTLYGIEGRNVPETIKLQNSDYTHDFSYTPTTLATKLFKALPNLRAYKDASLSEAYSLPALKDITKRNHVDTIITFDPNTFQEIVQVVVNELLPEDIHAFKVKQIIHYNEKTGQLGVTPTAIAPVEYSYDKQGKLIAAIPLFWIPIKEFSEKISLNNNDITWVKRITRSINQKDIKVIKGDYTLGEVFGRMMALAGKNAKTTKLYHTFSTRNMQPMSTEEISNLEHSIDTIITFDPKTFNEIVQVVENHIDPTKIEQVRIIQEWVFDEAKQNISIALLLYAPITNRYDDAGNFLNSGPMFYRKSEE